MEDAENEAGKSGQSRIEEATDYESRLLFLYNAINDTQNTIRFLDTKAAFCVTLLTAMMAAAFQFARPVQPHPEAHRVIFFILLIATLACLAMCLRVIFPTIHLQGELGSQGPIQPAFFPVPRGSKHWFLDSIRNHPPQRLETTHHTYRQSMFAADDADLLRSLCDEMIAVSVIRQLKADRLHVAILALSVTLVAFFVQLVV